MKKIYVFAAIFLILAAFCLNSCGGGGGTPISAPEHEALACAFVDALSKKDPEALVPMVDEAHLGREEYDKFFKSAGEYVGGFTSYECKGITDYAEGEQDGAANKSAIFLFETDGIDFHVGVTCIGTSNKIAALAVYGVETGTLGSMEGASALQWIVLVIGILVIVFTALVFVDCLRSGIKSRAMWCAVILLGVLSLGATVGKTGIVPNAGFGFIIFPSALITYSTGGYALSLVIPVGAIAYLVMRKRLKRQAMPPSVQDAASLAEEEQEDAPKKEYYEWEE